MNRQCFNSLITFTSVDVLTHTGLKCNTGLTIDNNRIHSIGEVHGEEISLPGYLILPGMVNSHTHSPMNFLRDLCHGKENMIENIFFKTESQLTGHLTENLSYPYILSGIKSGVTSFVEHYYFMDGIASAFEKIRLRAFVGETLADLGGAFPDKNCLVGFKKVVEDWPYSDRIRPVLCPHAADTVSPLLAKKISEYALSENIPLHFHLAQRKEELEAIKKRYGKSPVQLVNEWGWLGKNSLAVHLLHVNNEDIHTLKNSGTSIVACPSSQILYEQLAPIEKFYQADIPISLGTDCAASNDQADILSELKILALLMKDREIADEQLYRRLFQTVTINPAKTLNSKIGEIKPGYMADLVFVKKSLDTLPLRDIWTHILFSYSSQHIDHVMIDGEFVLYEKKLCFTDESNLMNKFSEALGQIKFN